MTWPLVALGSVAEVQLGKMLSPKARTGVSSFPYLRNVNVQWGRLDLSDLIEMDFDEGEREKFALKKGDLLVCEGGEPGRSAVVERDLPELFFQKALMRVRPRNHQLDTRFLQRFMEHAARRGTFAKDGNQATIAHFPAVKLNALAVPLPPVTEQRRIADILDKADAIRRKRRETIALTQQLLQSAFLETFGDPVTNPKRWPVKPLTELCESKQYGTAEKANSDGAGLPVLRMNNLTYEGDLDLTNLKWVALSGEEASKLDLRDGDVLFNRVNSYDLVGKTAVWHHGEGFTFAGYLIRLRIQSKTATGDYVSAAMNTPSMKRTLMAMAKPSINMANISGSDLARVLLPVPPLAAQRNYVALRKTVDSLRQRFHSAERDAEALLASLVQRAFRGELTRTSGTSKLQLGLFGAEAR